MINIAWPEGEPGEINKDYIYVYNPQSPVGIKKWECFTSTPEDLRIFIADVKAGKFDHFLE